METLWINPTQYSEKKGIYFQQAHGTHITEEYTDSPPRYISKQLNHEKEI